MWTAGGRPLPLRTTSVNWKNVDFLLHRWLGISLGLVVLLWFLSGIAMMYYPYPQLTAAEQTRTLPALRGASLPPIVSFPEAYRHVRLDSAAELVGARFKLWNGQPTYELWTIKDAAAQAPILVSATTGERLPAVDSSGAHESAARVAPRGARVRDVTRLPRGDHYFMGAEWRNTYPVFRITYDDPERTAIYVSSGSGEPAAIIGSRARWTTWLGTVPHWIYVQWLYYDHYGAWLWISILLPFGAVALAMFGVILGVWQLFPFRRRADWRVSGYRGVSRWHHIAGVCFGVVVITWTLSGMLEVLGPSWHPNADTMARARGQTPPWDALALDERQAIARAESSRAGDELVALDLEPVAGTVGYVAHYRSGTRLWLAAASGSNTVRREISESDAARAARRVRDAPIVSAQRLTSGDAYYYPPRSRNATLPVWRVQMGDDERTAVYLDPVTGMPAGVVNASVRRWRWWRDALHNLDLPGINGRRPLWDAIVLTLMLGGSIGAFTGVWLLVRRVRVLVGR